MKKKTKRTKQFDYIKFAKDNKSSGLFLHDFTYEKGKIENCAFNTLSKEQCEIIKGVLMCYLDYVLGKEKIETPSKVHSDIIEYLLKLSKALDK
jgi:hypothetical protein